MRVLAAGKHAVKHKQALGKRGEDLTASLLARRGYIILERNYKAPRGEVDLIAVDGDTLAFIEVKTRSTGAFGEPQLAVQPAKRRRIIRGALHYLGRRCDRVEGLKFRCDVAAVRLPDGAGRPEIELIKNAFSLEEPGLNV